MEATVLLVLVLGLVFGGMTLMLGAGYVSTEKERARQEQARRAGAAKADAILAVPGFFQPARPQATPIAFVFDDGLVDRLEARLRTEQALVAQFVHHPSIDNLYPQLASPRYLH
jgi:hypothetical protein